MLSNVYNSCLRLFVLSAVLWFSLPLLAADRNLTEMEELTFHNACERLLEADLSGHYVATNLASRYSQLVQLRRLGHTSAYTLSTAKMDLPSTGIRELQFERTGDGWRLGDPGNPEARVNIMTLVRESGNILFRFENASDPLGFTYDASPINDETSGIRGDILKPDEWAMRFNAGFDANFRFTRVRLDRAFELAVSQSLKSLLANRLEPDSQGIADYLVTVEMKTPLLRDEAVEILGTDLIYPMDEGAGSNSPGPFYRFAVPKHIYELLESVGRWTRRWQVAHIDAVSFRLVNRELIEAVVNHINLAQRGFNIDRQTGARAQAPAPAARPAPQPLRSSAAQPAVPVAERGPETDALAALRQIGNGFQPRDLDADREQAAEDEAHDPDQTDRERHD